MKRIKSNIIILFIAILMIGATIYTYYNLNKNPSSIELMPDIGNIPECCEYVYIYRSEEIEQFIYLHQLEDNKIKDSQKKNNQVEQVVGNVIDEETPPSTAIENKISYTEEDLYWLSKVIAQELGANWVPDYYQQCVGSVVLNRVNDSRFPNTIYGVLHQSGQYCGFYAEPTTQNIANAKYLLENGSVLPENVVFQALFVQGSGTYCSYYDPVFNNTTYFCY